MIALNLKGLETSADTYKLSGNVSGEQHVEDVYIFVSNSRSKIESRKVFYRSNRSGKDGKQLDFSTDLPLWPGSNMVTVVARASSEVRSIKTMYVYREPPRTAPIPGMRTATSSTIPSSSIGAASIRSFCGGMRSPTQNRTSPSAQNTNCLTKTE